MGTIATSHSGAPRPSLGGAGRLGSRAVRRMGYGVMQLSHRPRSRAQSLAVLSAAADAGIDHFDTAQFYDGANALIAEALGARRNDLVLVSKVGAAIGPDGLTPAQTPEQLRAQVEENLASLGTDHLDVVNLRRLDGAPGIIATGDQIVDLDSQLAELLALRDEGKIGGIGLSVVSAAQLTHALGAGIVCVQNLYNLLERESGSVLAICREHGIAWAPFFPLGSSFPGRAKVTDEPAVISIAAEIGATPAQVGLAWLLADYDNTLLIPGTTDLGHLAENIGAGDLALSTAQIGLLGALGD